jgi:O-antigen/teichoic acid export membrane protein
MTSLLNIALRGITMAARFVLLVVLAAYSSTADVGLFALFTATNQWGIYLQGLELYLFTVREVVAGTPSDWARRTRDAFALYAVVFTCACALWLGFFASGFMPWSVCVWFLVLLALEQTGQELYRLLNAFGRPLAGSVVLFARTGSWMYVVAALMWREPAYRDLETVFAGWVIGSTFSVVLALVFLRDLPWRGLPRVDWKWLRRGIAVGVPLLVGSLAWRGIAVFERWYIGHAQGETAFGVFGFFATVAAALPVLADSGIGAVLYPRMMKAWQIKDVAQYRVHVRRLWLAFVGLVVVSVPAALFVVGVAVRHLRDSRYREHIELFYVLIASAAVGALAAVPQYILWAKNRDRTMIAISIATLVTTVVLDLFLVSILGTIGAAWGQLGGMCMALLLRLMAVSRER